ncbi:MAG: molecular chaperone DnaJ [Bacilli bacterium]
MAKKDYYSVLGIDKNASNDEIKSAYRKLAKKYHPDISKDEAGAEKFKEAQEAYSVLSDEGKRKQYDQFGHAAFDNNGGSNPGGAGGYDFGGFDFSSIFDDLMGGNSGYSSFNYGDSRKSSSKRKGRDCAYQMDITFEEAAFGCKKDFKLEINDTCSSCDGKGGFGETKCSSCNGKGYVISESHTIFGSFSSKSVCSACNGEGVTYDEVCSECRGKGIKKALKTITIDIPKGINTGEQIRMTGKGEAGLNGGPNGDIYIEFNVLKHDLFERKGNDIYVEVPLTIVQAALGCTKEIRTLNGKVDLKIEDGTQNGDILKLKGKGIENDGWGRNGDFYCTIKVVIPSKLSRKQRELLEELENTGLEDSSIFKKFYDLNK